MSAEPRCKVVVNAGAEAFVIDQLEDGATVSYELEPGESRELPLDDGELADRAARDATPAVERALPAAVPAGVIGWPCRELVGATCTHATCMPANVADAVTELAASLPAVESTP